MEEHRKFLADRLLSDEQPITYRLLSRALDVHVNTAKEMLYDFLQYQNGVKENSIHATYLLYGQKKTQETRTDGDVDMGSSQPEHDDATEDIVTDTLTLVAEESLKAILDEYEKITSINVYSLAPHPQKDLSLLSDLSRSVAEYATKEDPIEAARKYGSITNPKVRRRDRSGRPKLTAPSTSSKPVKTEAPPAKTVKAEPTPVAKSTPATKIKQEAAESSSKDSTPTSSANKSSAPSLKRGSSGGIMQSFAKAANKPKTAPKKKPEEDTAMSDDGEADEADLPAAKKKTQEEAESLRKAKKKREEQLKKMMEEDDEEEEEEEKEDEEMEDAPELEPEPVPVEETKPEPAEVVASSGDGRRRGKRRVTKKKRILDDQGYMVTINEEGWESFSEEDKPPPAKKQTPNPTPASSGAKAKKTAGKTGQGNIMSFFGKK